MKPVLEVLSGKTVNPPPCWFMRQAGPYLPEYRDVREKAGGFLNLCFNSDLAAEVTLQPVKRYGMDAAILFSDILIVPHLLGQQGLGRVDKATGEIVKPAPSTLARAMRAYMPPRSTDGWTRSSTYPVRASKPSVADR